MTVRLTRIYTRTGDAGETHLGDMSRVPKTDPRLVAYADVDEANSVLGVALALGDPPAEVAELLRSVQNDLFDVGADLSTPVVAEPKFPPLRVTATYTARLEAACDRYNEALPKLNSFILPGGTPAAALLHQARVLARRAERSVWALIGGPPSPHASQARRGPRRGGRSLSPAAARPSRRAGRGRRCARRAPTARPRRGWPPGRG